MINNNYDYRMPVYGTPGYHIPEYMNTSIRSGGYKKKYKSGGALTLPHMHTYEDDDFDNIEGGNIGEWLVDIVKTPLANAFSQKPEKAKSFKDAIIKQWKNDPLKYAINSGIKHKIWEDVPKLIGLGYDPNIIEARIRNDRYLDNNPQLSYWGSGEYDGGYGTKVGASKNKWIQYRRSHKGSLQKVLSDYKKIKQVKNKKQNKKKDFFKNIEKRIDKDKLKLKKNDEEYKKIKNEYNIIKLDNLEKRISKRNFIDLSYDKEIRRIFKNNKLSYKNKAKKIADIENNKVIDEFGIENRYNKKQLNDRINLLEEFIHTYFFDPEFPEDNLRASDIEQYFDFIEKYK